MKHTTTNHPQITIYSFVDYDRGAKARWLLTELGIPYKDHRLDRAKGENETEEFLRMNPMGRVPVLKIDDNVIFESGAICAYLADRFMEQGMAPALDSPLRGEYQQWMYFAACMLDVIQTRVMAIEDTPDPALHAEKEAALQADLRGALETLDRTLAKSSFLVGNKLTVADFCVAYHLYWHALWPELDVVTQEFPRVKAYVTRLQSMPSAIQAKVFSYQE